LSDKVSGVERAHGSSWDVNYGRVLFTVVRIFDTVRQVAMPKYVVTGLNIRNCNKAFIDKRIKLFSETHTLEVWPSLIGDLWVDQWLEEIVGGLLSDDRA
jgi:hypothetical protein